MGMGAPTGEPVESEISLDEMTGRLEKVYNGASVKMWVEALTAILNEVGPECFESHRKDLFVWGAKTVKDPRFFDALCSMNPGSSLTMNMDDGKEGQVYKEQLAFAYAQAQSDCMHFEAQRASLRQQISDNDQDGVPYDVNIDEAYENLDIIEKKQKTLYMLKDSWESAMLEAGMDPEDYPWAGLQEKNSNRGVN